MKYAAFILAVALTSVSGLAEVGEKTKSPIYSPVGKRDPFKPPPADRMGRGLTAINPLEKYSVEKYVLKAVLKGIGRAKAMFEDPEGKTFILGEGDRIGRERGIVSRILNMEVIITERTFNYLGAENLYERVLTLPPDEEEGQIDAPRTEVRSSAGTTGGGGGGGGLGGGNRPAPRDNAAPAAAPAPAANKAPTGGPNIGSSNVK